MPQAATPRAVEYPIGPSIAYVPLTRGLYAVIDAEDGPMVAKFAWHAAWNPSSRHFYARRKFRKGENAKRKFCFLHDFIAGTPSRGRTIDHIACNETLDNRRANLRPATKSEQARNRGLMKNNTSGFRGVYLERKKNLWRALIVVGHRRIGLGRFKDPIDAAVAYDRAARHHFGMFARPNFAEGA